MFTFTMVNFSIILSWASSNFIKALYNLAYYFEKLYNDWLVPVIVVIYLIIISLESLIIYIFKKYVLIQYFYMWTIFIYNKRSSCFCRQLVWSNWHARALSHEFGHYLIIVQFHLKISFELKNSKVNFSKIITDDIYDNRLSLSPFT